MTNPAAPSADDDPLRIGELARFAVACTDGEIPDHVRAFGQTLLMDTLGALLGGLRYPAVRAMAGYGGDAPMGRLLTLGTASTWLDADSGGSLHPAGARVPPVPTAHPAPHVLPVLLQAASRHALPDRDVLRIFVIATEIGMRFGAGTSLRVGLHPHGIHGPVAAATASVLLAGGDADAMAAAIELAATMPMAATLAVPMLGGTVRNLWTGLGCYYGALAAEQAAAGQSGSATATWRLYHSVVCTDPDIAVIAGDLGQRWQILDSYLKPYACARWVHPALDAFSVALAQAGDPGAADITDIEVRTFEFAASLGSVTAESDLHARFSVPWCLAALAVDGRLDAGGFLPGALARPAVAALAKRVRLVEDPAFSAALPTERPTAVTVHAGGRAGTAEVRNARGNPDNPLTQDEVADKFRHNVGGLLAGSVVDRVIDTLHGAGGTGTAFAVVAAAVATLLGGIGILDGIGSSDGDAP